MTDVTYLAKAHGSREGAARAAASWATALRRSVPGMDMVPALAAAGVLAACLTLAF